MKFLFLFKLLPLKKAAFLFRLVLGFIFSLSIISVPSFSQVVSPGYTIKNWTIEDGLPVSSVNNIIQAENGYLWLSTNGGLVRFDGVNFKLYTSADYPGLRGNRILGLVESNDGSILIINQGADIFALKDETFTLLSSSDQGVVGEVRNSNSYYKDKEGRIWFGDDNGIKIYDQGLLTPFSQELINKPVEQILKAEGGVVWLTYYEDPFLYRYEQGRLEKILYRSVPKSDARLNTGAADLDWISIPHNDNNDIEFIVTPFEIYNYKDNDLTLLYRSKEELFFDVAAINTNTLLLAAVFPLNSPIERSLFEFKEGELVKGSVQPTDYIFLEKILRGKDHVWIITDTEIYKDNELILTSENNIEDLLIDNEGTLWVPTIKNGLLQLKKNPFSILITEDGLNNNNVYSVFQDRDSAIWVGTFGSGLNKLSGNEIISSISIGGKVKQGHILTIEQLADQTLLIGGLISGISYLNPVSNTFELYPAPEFISAFSTHSIFEDSQQRLWVGTSPQEARGLFVRQHGVWETLSGKDNIPYANYQYIMETPRGDIWAAARGEGLVRYDGTSFYHYSTGDGLSSDFIRALYVYLDPETGTEWLLIGSEGDGLDIVRLEDGEPDFSSLVTLNQSNGLYDNSIHIILEDDFDRFWMNTNQGIFWITKEEVLAFLKGETETITSTSYTEEDGLAHREGNGGSQPSGIKAFDGTLWFAGQGGVVSVDPANIAQNLIAPPVCIQRIAWNGGEVETSKNEILLEADQRDFEITYTALSFLQPEKNQYRYKLEGLHDHEENEWHDVGNRRTAYFTNVPAGTYTFRVQGSNNDGVWSTETASVKITIAPFFYETTWFLVLAGSSVFGLALLILAMREIRSRSNQQKLERIISEKTTDLRKEKEEVERQKEIIDELSHAKDNFFTNISHELRTPLTLILGPLESLSYDTTGVPRSWKRNLDLARRNGFRLKQLVDQVLDLAKLESGTIEIEPVKLDVKAKTTTIIASFESLARSKKINLKTSIPDEEICAGVDPDKFQKILNNLVSNALKFTPEKGTVEVELRLNRGFVEISVSDTGIGIQKNRIPFIFDRFHSKGGETTGGDYGLGVGLNLTKELVELHGGKITVNSEYGKGSTFLVTLRSCPKTMAKTEEPVFEEEEDLIINEVPLHSKLPSRKGASLKTKILLVEDNRDMREYISDILSENNIEITEAENGMEGKKQLALIKPDVIISDVMMPDMSGFEFSRYVRSVSEYRLTPIMMLTALSDLDNRMEAFDIGVNDYLTKPFVEKELKVRIQNLLRLKDKRDKAINSSNTGNPEELSEGTMFARKLQAYVNKNISNPHISVEELGALVNMSRRQFYRKLKKETGFTPAAFVREIRLFKARHIIENKRAGTISEVAYSVGFSTPFHFVKIYEKRFGSHPGKKLKN